jgi:hypothetical protein
MQELLLSLAVVLILVLEAESLGIYPLTFV